MKVKVLRNPGARLSNDLGADLSKLAEGQQQELDESLSLKLIGLGVVEASIQAVPPAPQIAATAVADKPDDKKDKAGK